MDGRVITESRVGERAALFFIDGKAANCSNSILPIRFANILKGHGIFQRWQ